LDEKETIRKEALRQRDALSSELRIVKSELIRAKLFSLPEFIQAGTIMFFASFRSEVFTLPLLKEALTAGKRVVVPRVENRAKVLELYEIRDISELSPGYKGIPEPSVSEKRRRALSEVDLVVMPGAAFDIRGNRLGYGGGYYDRLLSGMKRSIPLVALAFHEQISDNVPSEPHDIRVHKIVTDAAVISCHTH
jgi:5-formyltetrahydrofolate cyclo-ligase